MADEGVDRLFEVDEPEVVTPSAPAGVAKTFRSYDQHQSFLLPPSPDYRSLSRFRRRHLVALGDLFAQVLVLCANAGLVKLGRVALDGTKLDASASKHTAMSYGRLVSRIPEVEAEVARLLAEAQTSGS